MNEAYEFSVKISNHKENKFAFVSMAAINSFWEVVELTTHNPKIKGSNPSGQRNWLKLYISFVRGVIKTNIAMVRHKFI